MNHAASADGRRSQPAAGRQYTEIAAAGRRAGPRDQESALDDPPQHGAVGRGFRRAETPRDRRAAGQDRGRAAANASGCRTCWTTSSTSPRSARLQLRAVGPERADRRRARLLRAQGRAESNIELIRYLDPELAQRGARPRVVSRRADQPGAQRQAGDARRRPAGRPHRRRPAGVALRPDRHRLRHGRAERPAQMFDAFFSTKPGGSGLGLPTTRKIIEAHGGRICVRARSAAARSSRSSCRCRRG